MLTAIIFIIVLGILVFVHEFGHFIFAKRAGMKVEEFGFGFPPRLWGVKKGETIYSINLIPFGGFVKILGEEGEQRDNPRSFSAKPVGSRLRVIIAGVTMNFFLAVALLMVVNFLGLRIGLTDDKTVSVARDKAVQIIEVSKDSPADKADIKLLDEVSGFKLNGSVQAVSNAEDVQFFIRENIGKTLTMVIKRNQETLEKEIIPRISPPAGQGALGVSLALTGVVSYPWYEAVWRGVYDAVILTMNTVIGYFMLFKTLLLKGKLIADVSGPVGIATLTGQAARMGMNYLMQFTAIISINLAVLNIIPFPALDGGRALLIIVEKLKGSPVNKKAEQLINTAGFAFLVALMVYVTAKDIVRFF
ncbi:MAG: site-2 protease family protein [Candidatus Yanofskybacteria bacterium]|nr:site-2 protease family protein [Candidatus Yanofskybacteria bacterium]